MKFKMFILAQCLYIRNAHRPMACLKNIRRVVLDCSEFVFAADVEIFCEMTRQGSIMLLQFV